MDAEVVGSKKPDVYGAGIWARGAHNILLQLTPKVRLWFVGRPVAGVRFALVIRRGN